MYRVFTPERQVSKTVVYCELRKLPPNKANRCLHAVLEALQQHLCFIYFENSTVLKV